MVVVHVVALGAVGHIEVVGQLRMFASDSFDTLHSWKHAHLLAELTYFEVGLLHVALWFEHEACNLEVAESTRLHLAHLLGTDFVE